MPYNIDYGVSEGEITRATNDWTEAKNGQSYLSRIREVGGRNAHAELVHDRREFEKFIEAEAIKAGEGAGQGGDIIEARGLPGQGQLDEGVASARDPPVVPGVGSGEVAAKGARR